MEGEARVGAERRRRRVKRFSLLCFVFSARLFLGVFSVTMARDLEAVCVEIPLGSVAAVVRR